LQSFDGFLLDAYGVLVDSDRTLPGASAFIEELKRRAKPFRIISNDASTTPEAKCKKWLDRGLEIPAEALITPWSVLSSGLGPVDVEGKKCLLIGTPLSREMLRRAGGIVAEAADPVDFLLLADELTPDLMNVCNDAVGRLVRAFEEGLAPRLVLLNPDLVYPTSHGYGLTVGAIALMIEAALERILGREIRFSKVGKPEPGLFELGLKELAIERSRVVMIGDQWDTDISGASRVGMTSVLTTTGLGRPDASRSEQLLLDGF